MKKVIGFLAVALVILSVAGGCREPEEENNDYPLNRQQNPQPRAVMIDDVIYYDSGQKVEFIRCGVMDGEITSTVESHQLPRENRQSNFGIGYCWQLVDKHHIDIPIETEGGWNRFCDKNCDDDHSFDLSGTPLYPGHTALTDNDGKETYFYNDGEDVKFYDGEIVQ